MGEEEAKKVEVEVAVAEEKAVIPLPHAPDDSRALAVLLEKTADPPEEKSQEGSINRDALLARIETEKKLALIKAWEESEKCKAENKAHKKMSSITAWENSKKAAVEADLKKIEENLEKKKAEYAEKMKNKVAMIHKKGEEKRALVEATRGEEILKAEEIAAKFRATGLTPKKLLGCIGF